MSLRAIKKRAPQNTRSTRTMPPARLCASARAAPASRASRAVGPGRRGTSRGAPAQMLSDADAAPAAGAPSGTSDGRGGGVATGWRLRWWRTSTERRLKAAPQTVHAWGRWRWCTTYMRGTWRRKRVCKAGCLPTGNEKIVSRLMQENGRARERFGHGKHDRGDGAATSPVEKNTKREEDQRTRTWRLRSDA